MLHSCRAGIKEREQVNGAVNSGRPFADLWRYSGSDVEDIQVCNITGGDAIAIGTRVVTKAAAGGISAAYSAAWHSTTSGPHYEVYWSLDVDWVTIVGGLIGRTYRKNNPFPVVVPIMSLRRLLVTYLSLVAFSGMVMYFVPARPFLTIGALIGSILLGLIVIRSINNRYLDN